MGIHRNVSFFNSNFSSINFYKSTTVLIEIAILNNNIITVTLI